MTTHKPNYGGKLKGAKCVQGSEDTEKTVADKKPDSVEIGGSHYCMEVKIALKMEPDS